jgi:hypothetical protein
MAIIKTLKIITHPQGARYNATLSTQPVIHVGDLDTVTNDFTIDTAYVGSVLVAEGPGNTGYNLSGTLTKTFVSGVATFTNVGIVPDSTNTALDISSASLSFVTTNLNIVTSNTFQISNASKLVVTSSPVPTTTTLGRVMQIPVKVQFKDVDDNDIPLSGISIVASAQGATMSGTTALQSGVSGFVIFTQLTFSGGSQVVVTFSSPGMTSAVITINLIPTNIIKPRRSIVAGDPPVVGDIVPFEIAINIPDRQLWVADETGTPVLISSGSGSSGSIYVEKQANAVFSSGTLTIDCALANIFTHSITANITTLSILNIPTSGNAIGITLVLTADGTQRTIAWPSSFKFPSGVSPVITSTANKKDVLVFFTYDSGSTWIAVCVGKNI